MFKYFFILSTFLMFAAGSFAQENAVEEQPVYLRFPTLPQFTVSKAPDSTHFTRENLKKNVNTVFFVFSPDCNHCQQETEAMIKSIKQFKNTQIVMVTYFPWAEMMVFYKNFKIGNHPQIVMARDNNYFFPVFFKVKNFPSIYVYDKKGNFKKAFEGSVKISDIIKEL